MTNVLEPRPTKLSARSCNFYINQTKIVEPFTALARVLLHSNIRQKTNLIKFLGILFSKVIFNFFVAISIFLQDKKTNKTKGLSSKQRKLFNEELACKFVTNKPSVNSISKKPFCDNVFKSLTVDARADHVPVELSRLFRTGVTRDICSRPIKVWFHLRGSYLYQVHKSCPELSICVLFNFFKHIFTSINYEGKENNNQ